MRSDQKLLKASIKRKRRRFFLRILFFSAGALLILGLFASVFYIPSLRLSLIAIEGLRPAEARELRAEIEEILSKKYLHLLPKNNFILFPRKEVENLLKAKPRLREFTLEREFPARLRISLKERETWAVWCSSFCLLIDREGFAFAAAPSLSGSVILKISDERDENFLGKDILPPEEFQKLAGLVERIPRWIGEEVENIELKISGDVRHLNLKSGWYFIIDDETDIDKALENLVLALDSEIKESRSRLEYIDLRFSDKVFYRYK